MSSTTRPARPLAAAGLVLLVLGIFGGLVPYVGPSFGYGMGDVPAWTWTESRATLHLLPGVVAAIGGFLLYRSRELAGARAGALLAAAGGVWFVIAPTLHPLWASTVSTGMSGMGSSALSSALSSLGYHYGTGVLITLVAAYSVGALAASRTAAPSSAAGADGDGQARAPLADSRR